MSRRLTLCVDINDNDNHQINIYELLKTSNHPKSFYENNIEGFNHRLQEE